MKELKPTVGSLAKSNSGVTFTRIGTAAATTCLLARTVNTTKPRAAVARTIAGNARSLRAPSKGHRDDHRS